MDRTELKKKTAQTAKLYFEGYPWDPPYPLWREFDPEYAKDLSLFITGQVYSREKIPHPTRQMITVAALTALNRMAELRLHLWAALNVGCQPDELSEVIFQTGIYAGMPAVNQALEVLREVKEKHAEWKARPA